MIFATSGVGAASSELPHPIPTTRAAIPATSAHVFNQNNLSWIMSIPSIYLKADPCLGSAPDELLFVPQFAGRISRLLLVIRRFVLRRVQYAVFTAHTTMYHSIVYHDCRKKSSA